MSNRQTDLSVLRRDVLNAETAVIALNRQLTEAIIANRATGTLSYSRYLSLHQSVDVRVYRAKTIHIERWPCDRTGNRRADRA